MGRLRSHGRTVHRSGIAKARGRPTPHTRRVNDEGAPAGELEIEVDGRTLFVKNQGLGVKVVKAMIVISVTIQASQVIFFLLSNLYQVNQDAK